MQQLMRDRVLSDEQIVQLLRDYEDGLGAYKICKKYDISESTYYRIKKGYRSFRTMKETYAKQRDRNYNLLKKKLEVQELEIKALKAALKKKF
jgi:putative transposase